MRPALAVASECAPLIKTGGLADVVGALPGALATQGWALRTLIPGYRGVLELLEGAEQVWSDPMLFGGPARLLAARHGSLDLLVLDAPHLYDRAGSPYLDAGGRDWPDNDIRFAALCWTAAAIAAQGLEGWRPDLLHLHDWQAGFTPVYLEQMGAAQPCVMTIHNIAFHGLTAADRLAALALPEAGFSTDGFEYYGHISALKAGLTWAARITTVSPTYARELTMPEFGMGLDGVIRARSDALVGILNGIDAEVWNPATDPHVQNYTSPRGKRANKRALTTTFGLPEGDGPLCVVISRLSQQKGLDMLLEALPTLIACGGRLAMLGSGDRRLENAWLEAADATPEVAVRIGYDEPLAHRMFAGGDAVLVPSRFEPCGLTQLYGLRYGTVPVVALTGGLADTVITANDAGLRAGCATGISYAPLTADALGHALRHLCALHDDARKWARLQRNAMRHPVDWTASAPQYAALFDSISRRA